jgi:hypothetical protein
MSMFGQINWQMLCPDWVNTKPKPEPDFWDTNSGNMEKELFIKLCFVVWSISKFYFYSKTIENEKFPSSFNLGAL